MDIEIIAGMVIVFWWVPLAVIGLLWLTFGSIWEAFSPANIAAAQDRREARLERVRLNEQRQFALATARRPYKVPDTFPESWNR